MLREKKVREVEEVKEVKDCEAGIGWMAGEETKELTQRARRKNTEGTEKRSLHLENHRGRKRAKSARPGRRPLQKLGAGVTPPVQRL